MAQVTGMGCLASSICAAFLALEKDSLKAAVSAMSVMSISGELAGMNPTVRGPGSFRSAFLDALSEITQKDIHSLLRIEVR